MALSPSPLYLSIPPLQPPFLAPKQTHFLALVLSLLPSSLSLGGPNHCCGFILDYRVNNPKSGCQSRPKPQTRIASSLINSSSWKCCGYPRLKKSKTNLLLLLSSILIFVNDIIRSLFPYTWNSELSYVPCCPLPHNPSIAKPCHIGLLSVPHLSPCFYPYCHCPSTGPCQCFPGPSPHLPVGQSSIVFSPCQTHLLEIPL